MKNKIDALLNVQFKDVKKKGGYDIHTLRKDNKGYYTTKEVSIIVDLPPFKVCYIDEEDLHIYMECFKQNLQDGNFTIPQKDISKVFEALEIKNIKGGKL